MKNVTTLTVISTIFLFLVLGCSGGFGEPAPLKYQGQWTGSDGTTLYMDSEGGAGYEIKSATVSGSTDQSVSGGAATFDDSAKTLTISYKEMGARTWKIDKEPNDDGEMTLNGIVFRKN